MHTAQKSGSNERGCSCGRRNGRAARPRSWLFYPFWRLFVAANSFKVHDWRYVVARSHVWPAARGIFVCTSRRGSRTHTGHGYSHGFAQRNQQAEKRSEDCGYERHFGCWKVSGLFWRSTFGTLIFQSN